MSLARHIGLEAAGSTRAQLATTVSTHLLRRIALVGIPRSDTF